MIARSPARVLYVLKLADNCYYVGTTSHFKMRMQQHCNGTACAWTRRHLVQRLHSQEWVAGSIAGFLEDAKVLEMMARVGVQNVRGGTYNRMHFDDATLGEIQRKLWHNAGQCTQCGSAEHFAKDCVRISAALADTKK